MIARKQFQTTSSRGLDFNSPPMRLWAKGKKLGVWDPADIDLSQDVRDWQKLTEDEKSLLVRLTSQFQAGEEAVTLDLLPLVQVVAEEGRLEEEIYLTSFLFEEAKHVEAFARFFREVAQGRADSGDLHTPCYRQMFYEELPAALQRLRTDRSPVAQARASVTYNLVVEGVLAETGYHAYYSVLLKHNILPGMQRLVDYLKRDESRHLAYGVFLLSRLVAEHGEPVWDAIQERMNELMGVAPGIIQETFSAYEVVPFGIQIDDYLEFAMAQFQHRMTRIEKARNQSLAEVYGIPDFELATAELTAG